MTLPPKALTVLASIREDLLSKHDDPSVMITSDKPVEITRKPFPKRKPWMKRAKSPNAFQRMCQRHDRW